MGMMINRLPLNNNLFNIVLRTSSVNLTGVFAGGKGKALKYGGAAITSGIIGTSRIYGNFMNQMQAPRTNSSGRFSWGAGYPTWFKTKGMPADHLGATGNLTISLSQLRHQSII